MVFVPLMAMVRKDLQLFFSDRRAVVMSFVVPIAIASFFGSLFSGPGNNSEPARIAVAIVDQDASVISKDILAGAEADKNLNVSTPSADDARDSVRRGKTSVAVFIPRGFGEASGQAFFSDAPKPALELLFDPSHSTELAMVRGILTEHVMQSVSQQMFGGPQGRAAVDQALATWTDGTCRTRRSRPCATCSCRCRPSTAAQRLPAAAAKRPARPVSRCRTR